MIYVTFWKCLYFNILDTHSSCTKCVLYYHITYSTHFIWSIKYKDKLPEIRVQIKLNLNACSNRYRIQLMNEVDQLSQSLLFSW